MPKSDDTLIIFGYFSFYNIALLHSYKELLVILQKEIMVYYYFLQKV